MSWATRDGVNWTTNTPGRVAAERDDEQGVKDASDYHGLIQALTEALGGETKANDLYFRWLDQAREGGANPDHRELFRAKGDVQAKTAFRLGQFFGNYFPWCCGLVFLYAANKLREYVAVIQGMEQRGVDLAELNDIICYVDDVVQCVPVDALMIDSSRKSPSIGSILLDASHDFDAWWAFYADTIPQYYVKQGMTGPSVYEALKERQAARRALHVRSDTRAVADLAFDDWMRSKREHLGDGDENLQFAYAIANSNKMHPLMRRSGVQRQLWDWLNEKDMENEGTPCSD